MNQRIALDKSGTSWVQVDQLSAELQQQARASFSELFALHPSKRGMVVMDTHGRHHNTECRRWHQSYGCTPPFRADRHTSYMFSGLPSTALSSSLPLPEAFEMFRQAVNPQANQVVVNWYDDDDKIALHADYTEGLRPGSEIAVISFNERDEEAWAPRVFLFKVKKGTTDAVQPKLEVPLLHGTVIRMGGDTQIKFCHGVARQPRRGRRISVTLREYKTDHGQHQP